MERIMKACDGKTKYDSWNAAQQHINLFLRESSQEPYKCDYCESYHIATIPGTKDTLKKKPLKWYRDKREPKKMKMKNKPGRRRKSR